MDKLKSILNPIKEDLLFFENCLADTIKVCDNYLFEDLSSFLFNNAKRLRPAFIFLFSKILEINDDKVMLISLISEIIHNASLIHDDIIDEENSRRLASTFYNKFGSKKAVLEGDLLLSLALNLLSNTDNKILKIYSEDIFKTINAEIQQNCFSNVILDEEKYINKTLNKTGNLFLCGLKSLFTIKSTDENLENNLLSFMTNYSIAFQIKNDIKDIADENFSDINNGNYTLPVIYFCNDCNKKIISDVDIKKFIENKSIYIEKTNKIVNKYKNDALDNLIIVEDSKFKNSLMELTSYTL